MNPSLDDRRPAGSESIHERLVLLYLGLPAVVFLLGFIDGSFAIPIVACIVASLYLELRARPESGRRFGPIDRRLVFLSGAIGLVVLLVVGFPSGPFAWDWVKHWALLNAMASSDWPTTIDVEGVPHYLRFYMGAYLVPAALARFASLPTWLGFGLWLWLGYGLVVWMAVRRAGHLRTRAALGAGALLLGIAGADIWSLTLLRNLSGAPAMPMLGTHSEWWMYATLGVPVQYSSILAALVWVPHQSIATLLVAGALLFRDEAEDLPGNLLAYGLLALWSPFGMIGLLPLVLLRGWRFRAAWLKPRVVVAGAAAASFAGLMAVLLSGGVPGKLACLACVPERIASDGLDYLIFLAVELAFFAIVLGRRLVRDPVCLACVALLAILPLVAGDTPDLVMRVSLGPLGILALLSVDELFRGSSPKKLAWTVALLLCVPTALGEVAYQRSSGQAHLALARLAPQDPLASRWYFSFAPTSAIEMPLYMRVVPPTEWGQYFTTERPPVYREP